MCIYSIFVIFFSRTNEFQIVVANRILLLLLLLLSLEKFELYTFRIDEGR